MAEVTNGSRVSSHAMLNYTMHKKVRRAKEAGLSERKLSPAYQLGTQGSSSLVPRPFGVGWGERSGSSNGVYAYLRNNVSAANLVLVCAENYISSVTSVGDKLNKA